MIVAKSELFGVMMTGTHDLRLVALSLLIALLTSYTALELAERVTLTQGRARVTWLIYGAIAMGIGLWSVHFVAMLAFHLPMSVKYDVTTVLLSVLVAVFVSAVALLLLSSSALNRLQLLAGGVFIGLASGSMHYIGMVATRVPANVQYNQMLLALALEIVISASCVALWLAFAQQDKTDSGWQKLGSTLVLGLGINGMHYTAVAATHFTPCEEIPATPNYTLDNSALATAIGIATLLLLGLTLLISLFNQRLAVQAKAQEMLAMLIKQMHVGVLLLGAEAEIHLSNPAACELLGLKEDQLLGKTAFDPDWNVIHEDGTPFSKDTFPVPQAIARSCPVRDVVMGVNHSTTQDRVWLLVNAEPLLRADGSVEQVICTLSNITQRKHEEEARQRSEVRNQQLEDMICALSHDLRTPLLATRTTLKSMLRGAFGPVSETWTEVLEEYRQANEDILKLVEALLEISRYEVGGGDHLNYESVNWEKLFVQTTTQISAVQDHKCAFICKISPSLPTVYGDHLALQRVVQNLLDNAVRLNKQDLQIIFEVAAIAGEQVRVSVCDNGPGIAAQEKERLFQRFIQGRRGRRGRAGLGLYLCRQIVEAHGGTINVESQLGEGSTFWFNIPIGTNKDGFEEQVSAENTDVEQEELCPKMAI